jgi:hypothetical protein
MGYLCEACDQISDSCHQYLLRKMCIYVQLCRQTGSRNLTSPKTLPTIWYTYMTLVTKYQIFAINSYFKKMRRKISWTDRGNTVYPPHPSGSGGIIKPPKKNHDIRHWKSSFHIHVLLNLLSS